VIDTGPEFRLQALKAGITALDGVFLTHAHADHIHGLDDIRPLCRGRPIPVYGNGPAIAEFRERFAYIFRDTQRGGGKPRIETAVAAGPVRLGSLCFTPLPVKHGALDILGWKIGEATSGGSVVYLTDCTFIGEDTFRLIAEGGPPALAIIGALRVRPHETHFTFGEALEAALYMKAGRVLLTHLCHEHSHRDIKALCRNFAKKRGISRGAGIPTGEEWAAPARDGREWSL
jgi:phosphoribosyl 1,2-cyclic phosphate phosphodiesterase